MATIEAWAGKKNFTPKTEAMPDPPTKAGGP
jgi:hypothetical protein